LCSSLNVTTKFHNLQNYSPAYSNFYIISQQTKIQKVLD
jgi:hypothetical protein